MKQAIILIFAVMISSMICAQTEDWLWVQQAGGTGTDHGNGIATDSSGNSYVTGSFNYTATFGTASLISSGYYDIFVAKLDSSGNYLWVNRAGGTSGDVGYGIAIDSSGNNYVTGYFQGTATFGGTTLTSSGNEDIFVAKLDLSGNYLWATKAGGISNDYAYGISTDSSGNSYVTGEFTDTATFGTISLTSSGGSDIFIVKLDSAGNYLWAKKAGGTNEDYCYSISTDSSGNSYVTGEFYGIASFGTTTLTSSGGSDIFIAKLDSNGSWLWAKKAGSPYSEYGYAIATDDSGNSYVTGYFQDTAAFGTTSLTSSGNNDIFIAKLDNNGNFLWAKKAGGTGYECSKAIATDSGGNSFVTGYFEGTATLGMISLTSCGDKDIFITKLDTNGNYLWAKQAGSTLLDCGKAIAFDSSGNSYVMGFFQGTGNFGPTSLISNGDYDIFIAKLSSDGVFVADELSPPATGCSYLSNAYPNPFYRGSSSIIKADVPAQETGVFTIYNLRGQAVQSQELTSGSHEISFSGKDLAPGIYFYRLKTTTVNEVKKLIMLR